MIRAETPTPFYHKLNISQERGFYTRQNPYKIKVFDGYPS
jgi:hypothetical protein